MESLTREHSLDGYEVYFDEDLARKYEPIVYDPRNHGKDSDVEKDKERGVYFRVMKKDKDTIIQYYYYWPRQSPHNSVWKVFDLFAKYSRIKKVMDRFGWRSPIHEYDYEPIIVFLKDNKLDKIAVAALGTTFQLGHKILILHREDVDYLGYCKFHTSEDYHYGKKQGEGWYDGKCIKENENVFFERTRVKVGIAHFSHVFSVENESLVNKLEFDLRELRDEILKEWYGTGTFGHDVTDPLSFPHIKFSPPPALEQLIESRKKKAKSIGRREKKIFEEEIQRLGRS